MNVQDFKIIAARKSDAPFIAQAVIDAVGKEIALDFAGSPERLPLVHELFTTLAGREDSQYSYRNSLVALDDGGAVAGVIVSYDGARLHELRKAFIEEAARVLGLVIDEASMPDETSDDEIYLDSLCVFPAYRGHRLATRLIEAAVKSHAGSGKPIGLLVDPDNPRARRLYDSLGFRQEGERPFAGVMMRHMLFS